MADGEVVFVSDQKECAYGSAECERQVRLQHVGEINKTDGTVIATVETTYTYLDTIVVNKGDKVNSGELIGTCGDRGKKAPVGRAHLHLEVRLKMHKDRASIHPPTLWNHINPCDLAGMKCLEYVARVLD